ncbi:MAG: type II toxin-antitoxin system VapC family toxin [Thermodesulfobacteriota bacterium]
MKYLLDTNLISELIKPQPDPGVEEGCSRYQGELVTAAPVWHELQFGCYRMPPSRKKEVLEMFLEEIIQRNIPILPYDSQAARWHSLERARLTAAGLTPSYVDGQIAAIAVIQGLILVTRNKSDFQIFSGLKSVSWHSR